MYLIWHISVSSTFMFGQGQQSSQIMYLFLMNGFLLSSLCLHCVLCNKMGETTTTNFFKYRENCSGCFKINTKILLLSWELFGQVSDAKFQILVASYLFSPPKTEDCLCPLHLCLHTPPQFSSQTIPYPFITHTHPQPQMAFDLEEHLFLLPCSCMLTVLN